ncbi:MAG: ATPase [Firmicutes bacterium]|nr:ATPase [Bacillota bacterium]
MGKTKVIDLLDRLEVAIESARRVPLIGKAMVDSYELLEIIDQIRIALPQEIKDAELLLRDKERLLSEARAEAERLVSSAQDHIASLVDNNEVVRAARAEAERILVESRNEVEAMKSGADEYVDETLANLEENLQRVLKVVRKGREELRRK